MALKTPGKCPDPPGRQNPETRLKNENLTKQIFTKRSYLSLYQHDLKENKPFKMDRKEGESS